MAIRRLCIENFQSHIYAEIELAEGLTVLVGESDSGKSSIIRALRWLLLNEPRGKEFIRAGANECRVSVILSNGARITRERTPSRNRYLLLLPGEAEKVFEGFGNDIPREITSLLGVARVHLDDDLTVALNMAGQLDEPFLLSQPGSLKARIIGRIQSVHIIDAASRDTAQDIARLQREARQLEGQVASLDKELAEFKDLPQLRRQIDEAACLQQRAEDLLLRQASLRSLAARIEGVRLQRVRHLDQLARLTELARGAALLEQGIGADRERNTLCTLGSRLEYVYSEMENLSRIIPLTNKLERAGGLIDRGNELGRLYRQVFNCRQELLRIDGETRRQDNLCQHTRHIPARLKQLVNLEQRAAWYEQLKARASKLARVKGEKESQLGIVALCSYLPRAAGKYSRIEPLKTKLIELGFLATKLKDILDRLDRGKIFLNESNMALKSLAREYGILLQDLGRCPTCLEPVSRDSIRRIIMQLTKGVDDGDKKAVSRRN
jgi:exonuclease SbcC